MIAARQIYLGRGGANLPTARSYVQDGLVAMWDGIENAGYGVHDASATTWKDLTGNRDFALTNNGSFSENSLVCDGGRYAALGGATISRDDIHCIEYVFRTSTDNEAIVGSITTPNITGQIMLARKNTTDLICMFVQYSADNLKNCVKISTITPHSYSFLYSATNTIGAYIDGVQATLSYSSWAVGTSGNICLGGRNVFADKPMGGSINSIRIYNRALTAAEIAANYAIDKARFNLP